MNSLLKFKSLFLIFILFSCTEEIKTFRLNITIDPANSGTVTPSSGTFEQGSSINLIATPSDGHEFSSWSGSITSVDNPLEFQINSDIELIAKFSKIDLNSNDIDNDGVIDDIDNCPNTPSGFYVDENGCLIENEFDSSFSLIWSDEFSYDGKPDSTKWHHQIIPPDNGGWYNGEEQHYTDRIENSYVSDSTLKIKVIKESYDVNGSFKNYTSARLNSKFAFKYGRVDIRAKLPSSSGTWPAFWTLGTNINEIGNYFGDSEGNVGWPMCGEIDIMEQSENKSESLGHFHWGDVNNGNYGNYGEKTSIENASSEYHIYSLIWDESSMQILLDNKVFLTMTNTQSVPFDNRHYILINVAMGGNLGGSIDPNFVEDEMIVDYVRVFKKN
ncbi:MAG: hypothetical protein CMG63_04820 [Candidatus Marinimicrobia bacterium]|nr:hypothetical protein [Candidatus Neomarinimicrobiota bacterium]